MTDVTHSPYSPGDHVRPPPSALISQLSLITSAVSHGLSCLYDISSNEQTQIVTDIITSLCRVKRLTSQSLQITGGIPAGSYQLDLRGYSDLFMLLSPVMAVLGCECRYIRTGDTDCLCEAYSFLLKLGLSVNAENETVSVSGTFTVDSIRLDTAPLLLRAGILIALPLLKKRFRVFLGRDGICELTLRILRSFNVFLEYHSGVYYVFDDHVYIGSSITIESDAYIGCVHMAIAVLRGQSVTIDGIPHLSKQCELYFLDILRAAGARAFTDQDSLCISSNGNAVIGRINANLNICPNLIPLTAVLAAAAKGESTICCTSSANLLQKSHELVRRLGCSTNFDNDRLVINGIERFTGGDVDCFGNPYIASAAVVAAAACDDIIRLTNAHCLSKVYPKLIETVSGVISA